jgi:DeoR family transcriptional regulator, aga operon transcriptional repressor
MQQSERLGAILERLSTNGSVSVAEIAASLGVSAATIRRDLRLLEDQRLLDRTHGGAVPQGVLYELPLRYKSARQPQEKLRNIASELAVRPNLKLVVTGGVARAQSYELVGPIAEASLEGLNLDMTFLAVDGISPRAGLTTHHEIEAHTNRALVDRASQVTVVADSSKIGKVAFARICELTDVDELITDSDADADAIAAIQDAGVRVTTV